MSFDEFEALLNTFTERVYQHEAVETNVAPYIVWHEYRNNPRYADNKPKPGFWRVQADYYTKGRKDTVPDEMEAAFAEREIPFVHLVSYESSLRLIRHVFDCEVLSDG